MPYRTWVKLTVFNLLLVAVAGAVMRYKIAYSLPWVDQKNLLHAHSHFAFSGWVTAALFTIITKLLYPEKISRSGQLMFLLLCFSSYAMLASFPFVGYAAPSIFFSALTVVFSYILLYQYWKPLSRLGEAGMWIRLGLVFGAESSLGTFALAYLMKQPGVPQQIYIGSVYFFLHFQYNGWFFFSIIGILVHWLSMNGFSSHENWLKWSRWLFTIAIVPGFFLSTLWMKLDISLYLLAVIAALIQIPAFILLVRSFPIRSLVLTTQARWAWGLSLAALAIKVLLQLLSCIPALTIFAFGYRPLVIAYLHLILLGMVTLFLLGYYVQEGWLKRSKAFFVFIAGVVINEVLLIVQGLGAIGYASIGGMGRMLFFNSLLICASLLFFRLKVKGSRQKRN
jgi:hypothetical protein